MTTLIPANDLTEFLRLPAEVQADIELWLGELARVTKPIQKSLSAIAARMGVSLATARRKYDDWRRDGSWRALVNRAKVPEARGLDDELIAFWQSLCQQFQRNSKAAHREFIRQFRAGLPIPGIDVTIERQTLPPGLSYDNLIRYSPTKFELAAARIGRSAAADFRPKVFTTRVGLAVGQRYIFDDMWHDFKVVTIGQRRAMRLLQLHAHDLFSGCQFARGIKPRIEDEATGKSVNLTMSEMLFLVAHVLTEFGYHPDGCVLMVEHGTAALAELVEKVLFEITGGRVTVERSGIEGASAFAGQYAGRGKGNFRFKAALESLGNLIHNETANLIQFPGQTGSNSRLNAPEEMAGRDKHTDALLKAIAALPAERATKLMLPYLEVNQAKWLVEEVLERINCRTDHELQGWLEAGLTTMDFELPDIGIITAQKFLAMPADRQAALEKIATPIARQMSPREVFDAGRPRLIRLRPEQTALLLRDVAGREVTVGADHLIAFDNEMISPNPLRYLAHHFAPGDKFTAVVNPLSPNSAHLFDGRGSWVGIVSAWQTVRRDDIAGLHRQMGQAAKVEAELLTPVAAAGAKLTQQRIAAAQNNAEVLGGDAKRQARKLFIYGPSHIGKTWTTERYYAPTHNHGRTIYCRMEAASGLGGMVRAMATAAGISADSNTPDLIRRLKAASSANTLWILDEVHLLANTYRKGSFFACMEVIREIFDKTECGMVLIFTILDDVKAASQRELQQLWRRGVHKVPLPLMPTKADVAAILAHHEMQFPDRKLEVTVKGVTESPYEIIRQQAKNNGLKAITERLRYARKLGDRDGARAVTWEHFVEAHLRIEKQAVQEGIWE